MIWKVIQGPGSGTRVQMKRIPILRRRGHSDVKEPSMKGGHKKKYNFFWKSAIYEPFKGPKFRMRKAKIMQLSSRRRL